jgi:hypothetical protein
MGPYVVFIFESPLFLHPKSTYGRRCLTLKGNVRHALSTCEAQSNTCGGGSYRRILRKIFGPAQNKDGSLIIRMNYELNELIENADIVRFIKKVEE